MPDTPEEAIRNEAAEGPAEKKQAESKASLFALLGEALGYAKAYLQAQLDYTKLDLADKGAAVLGFVVALVLALFFFCFSLAFMAVTLALLLGYWLGSYILGFFLATLAFAALGVLLLWQRRRLIQQPILRQMAAILYPPKRPKA